MTASPRQLHEFKAGVRLLEVGTGTVWTIDRVERANTYAIPWVHLRAAEASSVLDGGRLLTARDGADDWRFA